MHSVFKCLKVVHTIRDTPPNVHGIMDLTTANDSESYLAYPGSIDDGRVNVFDATNLTALLTIHAHDSLLAALRFSNDAKKLATASTKGTVIRVFAIPSGERLFEFTRGLKRFDSLILLFIFRVRFLFVELKKEEGKEKITRKCFNIKGSSEAIYIIGGGRILVLVCCNYLPSQDFVPYKDSLYLCSSSNTETVHVYKLEKFDDQIQQRFLLLILASVEKKLVEWDWEGESCGEGKAAGREDGS
uniref:Uncharacterized protein n=1 Tax=Parascaris equorum TaxID=6256 RepID=A0A914RU37_PAREQ